MEEGMDSFPKAGKPLLSGSLRFQGNTAMSGKDTELADLGQNNPAVPLPNCIALGIPPILPNPLLNANKTSVSHRAYEGSNEMMPVLRVMTTSGLYA